MLIIDDLSVRIAGRLLIEHASVRIRRRLANRIRRPQRQRQEHPVQRHHPRRRRRAWRHRAAVAMARRTPRPGSAQRARKPDRGRAQGRRRADAPAGARRNRAGPARDRRNPDPAGRHGRLRGAVARGIDPLGPRLLGGRPGPAVLGILRRLADAGRARRDAVRRTGPAAARRADQLSRSRRHALAAGSSRALSAHHDRHQP